MTAGRLPHVSSTSARPQTAKSTYVSISLAVCNNRFDFTLCHNSGNLGKHMKTPWSISHGNSMQYFHGIPWNFRAFF